MKSNACPACGSEEIEIELKAFNPGIHFDMNNGISALSFGSSEDATIVSSECRNCHAMLKATSDGYRKI